MNCYPGTAIEAKTASGKDFLEGIFVAGNIVMSQISELTGLGTPTLRNWVNRGFLSHPVGKKYNVNQLARILIINSLRNSMKLEDIKRLLVFVNGDPENERDNIIDESLFYYYACDVVLSDDFSLNTIDNRVISVLSRYDERFNGSKERLSVALGIVCKTYIADALLKETELTLKCVTADNIFGQKID